MLRSMSSPIARLVPPDRLDALCHRWRVAELCLFGSALRNDFGANSDIDLLVTFTSDAGWRGRVLLRMQEELETLFGRKVDLVERAAIEESENWIRRRHILEHAEPVSVAR
jgi:predicted nucleotidyltransferase